MKNWTFGGVRIAGLWLACCTALSAQTLFNEFPAPMAGGIAAGPDGAVWFTAANSIGRITTLGAVTQYPVPTPKAGPGGITAGPDGALWFLEMGNSAIGRITTSGVVTEYPTSGVGGIAAGPDGALWFTQYSDNVSAIVRMTPNGLVTNSYPLPSGYFVFGSITAGPDGALWFLEGNGGETLPTPPNHYIARITTSGVMSNYLVSPSAGGVTTGPDGALWFTVDQGNQIERITTTGVISEAANTTYTPDGITVGPDGALWVTELGPYIGRVAIEQPDAFFTGQQLLSPVLKYLQFQDGNPFGYYAFLSGSASTANATLVHADLGEEYVAAGSATHVVIGCSSSGPESPCSDPLVSLVGALYLYDFASGHWWYTSSAEFPFLYDYTLNAWIYYFPNSQSAGHYTSNPRSFANMTTGQTFTM
jgi:virginiamycin B lyase